MTRFLCFRRKLHGSRPLGARKTPLGAGETPAPVGVPLAGFLVFSSLYFRRQFRLAQTYARPPADCAGIFIITPTTGLVPHNLLIRQSKLRAFARAPIDVKNRLYSSALRRSARKLASEIGSECEVVLLGSIASGKYLNLLSPIRMPLRVPAEFVGRGI